MEQAVILIEMEPELSLEEICHALQITPDIVYELIEYGAIEPKGHTESTWRFAMHHVRKIRRALHLLNDLEVNMPGAVLAMELLEQIEGLQIQVAMFENYFRMMQHFSDVIK